MPYTIEALQTVYSLSVEDVRATLSVCQLPQDQQEYTDAEADLFRICRQLIEEGKSDSEVAELLQKAQAEGKSSKVRKPRNKKVESSSQSQTSQAPETLEISEFMDISELLAIACEQVGVKISLTESLRILQTCGLPDQEEYNQAECDRFLEACSLIKGQGKSFEEVAGHFGLVSQPVTDETDLMIEDVTNVLGESGQELINEMMRYKAKEDVADAPGLYLKHLATEFASPEFQQAWHQMEESLKAKIAGKFRSRGKYLTGLAQTLPPSQKPLSNLPPTSENG